MCISVSQYLHAFICWYMYTLWLYQSVSLIMMNVFVFTFTLLLARHTLRKSNHNVMQHVYTIADSYTNIIFMQMLPSISSRHMKTPLHTCMWVSYVHMCMYVYVCACMCMYVTKWTLTHAPTDTPHWGGFWWTPVSTHSEQWGHQWASNQPLYCAICDHPCTILAHPALNQSASKVPPIGCCVRMWHGDQA